MLKYRIEKYLRMKIQVNKNRAQTKKSDKPSRFLVELKSEIEQLTYKENEERKEKKNFTFVNRLKNVFSYLSTLFSGDKKVFKINDKQKKAIERVSFYPFLKVAYKVVSIIFWVGHFFLRFFYFSTQKMILYFSSFNVFKKKSKDDLSRKIEEWGDAAFVPGDRILGSSTSEKRSKQSFIKSFLNYEFSLPVFSKINLKKAFIFLFLLLALASPFKIFEVYSKSDLKNFDAKVLGISEEAFSNLREGSQAASSLDVLGAETNFLKAGDDLLSIKIELEKVNDSFFFLASLIPSEKIRLASEGKNLIKIGVLGTEIANNFLSAVASFDNDERKISDSLILFNDNINLVKKNIEEIEVVFNDINMGSIPEEYREEVEVAKKSILLIKPSIEELSDLSEKLLTFLGFQEDKRYLLVFQNNSELRASGGFIGSYALVDFSDGELENLEVPGGGAYDVEAGMREFIVAPEPLHILNPRWQFWDANWWPDFKKTAQKLMWFYEHSDGPTVDGVISLTPSVIEDLLEVFGSVDLSEDYGLVIDHENFWVETQALAERKEEETNKPKKIIGDLMDKMISVAPERINSDNISKIFRVFLNSLNEKHVMFYFSDEVLQNKVREYGWSGELNDVSYDYFMLVNTNIGGGKSDRVIEQKISHNVEINESGEIFDTVRVERIHKGNPEDPFTGLRNNSWMRFYVPLGSEFIEASGFWPIDEEFYEEPGEDWLIDDDLIAEREAFIDTDSWTKIYEDLGRTVFANWSWVNPGESVVVTLKYKLPFKVDFSELDSEDNVWDNFLGFFKEEKKNLRPYSLLLQKQPGAEGDKISSSLNIVGEHDIVWSYNVNNLNDSGWNIQGFLDQDKYWAVVLEE
ncbi:hypothetical protein C0584_01180 [Candidatus Parcubacteria bacterium]|nr:MAG: hypothetical protein C0584_01180 [Candidatus Parcubacteria bacterium]